MPKQEFEKGVCRPQIVHWFKNMKGSRGYLLLKRPCYKNPLLNNNKTSFAIQIIFNKYYTRWWTCVNHKCTKLFENTMLYFWKNIFVKFWTYKQGCTCTFCWLYVYIISCLDPRLFEIHPEARVLQSTVFNYLYYSDSYLSSIH